eukprot:5173119-Alexandrium_andersonii.AAC.1
MLCHFPKNPYCKVCRTAKLQQPPRPKGSFVSEATRFGAHLTCDFIASKSDFMEGIHGARDVFVVHDVWSGLLHAYATPDRYAENIIEVMKMLAGDHVWNIHKMYSDCGKAIVSAMKHYHILTQHGQPDVSKSNAIAERANRTVLEMTRALLGLAGLPACFRSEAAP